ncbi:MAG TPA: hypothetical protein ENI99_10610 [Sedimenticola sp.]|nr:hypothetical protein [Sedimenticola sp.]
MASRLHIIGAGLLGLAAQAAAAGTIVGSKHDLSTSGYYAALASASTSDEICIFCHTPHGFNDDLDNDGVQDQKSTTRAPAPLWNRRITPGMGTFTVYSSPTLNTTCDATPSPISLVCLSCHDEGLAGAGAGGVVDGTDMHNLVNDSNRGNAEPNCGACHPDGGELPGTWWQIGPDLSNDHPVSMTYPTAAEDPGFNIPPSLVTGWSDVKLFYGRVECPSCHNPHDPTNAPFLRKTLDDSSLCITCHQK